MNGVGGGFLLMRPSCSARINGDREETILLGRLVATACEAGSEEFCPNPDCDGCGSLKVLTVMRFKAMVV